MQQNIHANPLAQIKSGVRALVKKPFFASPSGIPRSTRLTKPLKVMVFTGGVISGLGKGVAAASVGSLLSEKYKIIPIKCDGYLNVDPGTMNPVEHGEVFVLDDGTEVDMDFGHYERFLGTHCKGSWNLTMGKVFDAIRLKERKGDYLGKTVQFIPHVTDYIQHWWLEIARQEQADVLLIEIGGTVGDMENELYVEAARQLKKRVGVQNIMYIHLTYVPLPGNVNELKSKPTQQSVQLLKEKGIFPDIILARASCELTPEIKAKIALFSDLPEQAIISAKDVPNIYSIPLDFQHQGVANLIERKLKLKPRASLSKWRMFTQRLSAFNDPAHGPGAKEEADPAGKRRLTIALCGKYTKLQDSYASIDEALSHASSHLDIAIDLRLVETTEIKTMAEAESALAGIDAVIVPGGFGNRGIEGKIKIIQYCREHKMPFLGICLGMQLAVVEFARNVCGLAGANSTEVEPSTGYPVIDMMIEQKDISDKGATMRLGAYPAVLKAGTMIADLYDAKVASERHRHRYEVNLRFHAELQAAGMIFSGMSPDRLLVEFIELAHSMHPYFVGTQAHPELKSTLLKPAPLFYGLAKAAMRKKYIK